MISYIILGLSILIGIYFYMQKSQDIEKKNDIVPQNKLNFYPSDKFNGSMTGYVFKMDEKGLGYYLDTNI
tara:strand:- start:212 stop:421 length:210 start_codon:yes stop_codon:yes gene_type:complete